MTELNSKVLNMRSLFATGLAAIVFLMSSSMLASASRIDVRIDISSQTMLVRKNGVALPKWSISTARPGYRTPVGVYKPVRLERMWYSTKYDNAPMPHSVFFYFGYAIHGTNDLRNLGRPVSHGCVRLHPNNARVLYNLIKRHGRSATRIVIQK